MDACVRFIGAVPLQEADTGVERPIAYFSKKLNQNQSNYSTIDKEALAIVLSVQQFELYLTNGAGRPGKTKRKKTNEHCLLYNNPKNMI